MKKFLATISLLFALSLFSITALAANSHISTVQKTPVETTISTFMTPRQQGLWYQEETFFLGLVNAHVTPTKGSELRVWVKSDNAIRVTVYKTNAIGTYTQVFSSQYKAGERDISVVSNCNGKEYVVQFRNDDGVTASALVYEK